MYCNPFLVRGCTSLLTLNMVNQVGIVNLKEIDYLRAIISSDGDIEESFKTKYICPLSKNDDKFLSGTISTTKVAEPDNTEIGSPYNIITGINTSFINELFFGDVIYIENTREALEVIEVLSNTELKVSSNANFTANNSRFFVLPQKIVNASKYRTAYMLLLNRNSETSYGQDAIPLFTKFNQEAEKAMKELRSGEFLDSTWKQRSNEENLGRFFSFSSSNDSLISENSSYINTIKSFKS